MNAPIAQVKKAPQPLKDVWECNGVRSTSVCVGPGNHNWSLAELYTPESGASALGRQVADQLHQHGVTGGAVFGPTPTGHNAQCIDRDDLTTAIPLRHGITLYRNSAVKADVIALDPDDGDTFIMSGGGCPIVIAVGDGEAVIAHASRDSLIDRKRIETGTPSREHESVMHTIAAQYAEWRIPLRVVEARIVFAVRGSAFQHSFADPIYGEINQAMYRDIQSRRLGEHVMRGGTGCLSIPALCRGLGDTLGFRKVSSSCQLPIAGQFGYTRHPQLKEIRNLEFVKVETIG